MQIVGIFCPSVGFASKVIKAIEVAGPTATAIATRIVGVSVGRICGVAAGTSTASAVLLENKSITETVVEIAKEAIRPELNMNLEKEILNAADAVGIGDVAYLGGKLGFLGGLIKGVFKLGDWCAYDIPGKEYIVCAGIVVGLGMSGYLAYKKFFQYPIYSIPVEVKKEFFEGMPEEKRAALEILFKIAGREKIG
jgi:hypothetical protein